jgi:hypothetical protein
MQVPKRTSASAVDGLLHRQVSAKDVVVVELTPMGLDATEQRSIALRLKMVAPRAIHGLVAAAPCCAPHASKGARAGALFAFR